MSERRVRLEEADDAQTRAFADEHDAEYARQKTLAGQWAPEEALAKARAEHAWLRDGRARAAGVLVWRALAEDGSFVGWLWAGPPPFPDEPGRAFLYQITVAQARRGQGWGRATLAALEDELRRRGWRALRLNVFRWNRAAWRLYETSGYQVLEEDERSAHFVKAL